MRRSREAIPPTLSHKVVAIGQESTILQSAPNDVVERTSVREARAPASTASVTAGRAVPKRALSA
jgi:hypothetical protein